MQKDEPPHGKYRRIADLSSPKLKDITEEEYNFCVPQWNSMPNLVRKLVEEGKLPEYILDRI
jgi:hypothetical protein